MPVISPSSLLSLGTKVSKASGSNLLCLADGKLGAVSGSSVSGSDVTFGGNITAEALYKDDANENVRVGVSDGVISCRWGTSNRTKLSPYWLRLQYVAVIGWSPDSYADSNPDTYLSRDSAGIVKVTDGSSALGTVLAKNLRITTNTAGPQIFSDNTTDVTLYGVGGRCLAAYSSQTRLPAASQLGWSADHDTRTAIDTGIARESAGVLKVTNGSSGYGSLETGAASLVGNVTMPAAPNTAGLLALRHSATDGNTHVLSMGASNVAKGGLGQGHGWIQSWYWGGGYDNPLVLQPAGGQVAIGDATAHDWKLSVGGTITARSTSNTAGDTTAKVVFGYAGSYIGEKAWIAGVNRSPQWTGAGLVFATSYHPTDSNGTDATERMRLDWDGNLLLGTTSSPTANGGKVLVLGDNGSTYPTFASNTGGVWYKAANDQIHIQPSYSSWLRVSANHFGFGFGTEANPRTLFQERGIHGIGQRSMALGVAGVSGSYATAVGIASTASNEGSIFVGNGVDGTKRVVANASGVQLYGPDGTTPAALTSGNLTAAGATFNGGVSCQGTQYAQFANTGATPPPTGAGVEIFHESFGGGRGRIQAINRGSTWIPLYITSGLTTIAGNTSGGQGWVAIETAGSERARCDTAGNFLLGTTSSPTANGGKVLVLGDNATDPTLVAGTAGIWNNGGVLNTSSTLTPGTDATYDAGAPTKRWRNIYVEDTVVNYADTNVQVEHSHVLWADTVNGDSNQELFLDGDGGSERISVPEGSAIAFVANIVGHEIHGSSQSAQYRVEGIIQNVSGAASMVTTTKTVLYEANAAWDVDITADGVANNLFIGVTGEAGTIIRWVADLRLINISYEHMIRFSTTPGTTANITVLYSYDSDAISTDSGDSVSYTKISGPDALTVDPFSGLVEWTPEPYEVGDYPVTIRATGSSSGLTEDQSWTITVLP